MEKLDLSPRTLRHVKRLFDSGDADRAAELLITECGNNLPLCKRATPESMERIRFAVLKLSQGDLNQLIKWIGLAKIDWRDVLMAAGFGNDARTHSRWRPEKNPR